VRLIAILALAAAAAAQPARIVSTAPSITEMLFAVGAGARVVGVTSHCHYPPEAVKLPKIGGYMRPNLESIAALRPDLVIVLKTPNDLAAKLAQLGIRTMELEHESVAGIYDSIGRIGTATGNPVNALQLTARIRSQLEDVQRLAAKLPRRRVTFIVGRTPGAIEGLIAVGGTASYLQELLALAGGDNIFRSAPIPYPKVSLEEMLARDPQVIIDMGDMAETIGVTEAYRKSVVALWNRYPALSAVRERRVHAVASDIFVVPGPRMVEAAREFLRMLHPEAIP
jgi:iron complex transport system substrate-binding protein